MNMTFEQIYNQMAWTRKPEKVEAKGGVIAGNAKLQEAYELGKEI